MFICLFGLHSGLVPPRTLSGLLFLWIILSAFLDSATVHPTVESSQTMRRFVFVSGYFSGPSKHTTQQYEIWIGHFLQIFVGELFFYTTPTWAAFFRNHTKIGRNVHFRVNYADPFEIPCMRSLRSVYQKQWQIDPEKGRHKGPHVYAIWNGKLCLVSEVSLLEPKAVVFWIDSGSCREQRYWNTRFPDQARLRAVIGPETKGIMIFAASKGFVFNPPPRFQYIRGDLAIGTFFGGDQLALREYWTFYWAIHDYFLERGAFVGKEQNLMSTYLAYTDRAWIQPNHEGRCNHWFSTFSFYGNTSLCFEHPPVLRQRREYFPLQTDVSVLKEWIKTVQVPFHPFGGRGMETVRNTPGAFYGEKIG